MFNYFTLICIVVFLIAWKMVIIVPMRESAILERLGKFHKKLDPGFYFLIPFVDKVAYLHEMREQVLDIPSQSCITRDNVQVEVDGVVYLKVMDPQKASYGIGDYYNASISLAQTTMRSEIGKLDLDDTFSEREKINENIVREIDKASDPWGIKVLRYEIRNITPSRHILDTMEKQMEAERQKRAQITLANGAKESDIKISQGVKQETINISEGEKQKRINTAEAQAREIELLSEATSEGIRKVAAAISKPGGNMAIRMRIVEEYVDRLGEILRNSTVSVVPEELVRVKGFFEGLGNVTSSITGRAVGEDDSEHEEV